MQVFLLFPKFTILIISHNNTILLSPQIHFHGHLIHLLFKAICITAFQAEKKPLFLLWDEKSHYKPETENSSRRRNKQKCACCLLLTSKQSIPLYLYLFKNKKLSQITTFCCLTLSYFMADLQPWEKKRSSLQKNQYSLNSSSTIGYFSYYCD